jgi:hyperosmotically inducible periplasmic protein
MKRSVFLVATVMVVFAAFAIAQYPSSQPSSDQSQSAQPSQASGSQSSSGGSSDVQTKIQKAFQQDPSLASSSVSANVTDDKIQLTGSVSSSADKDKAEQIAQQNAGGRKVDNKIEVGSSGTSSQPPSSKQPPK